MAMTEASATDSETPEPRPEPEREIWSLAASVRVSDAGARPSAAAGESFIRCFPLVVIHRTVRHSRIPPWRGSGGPTYFRTGDAYVGRERRPASDRIEPGEAGRSHPGLPPLQRVAFGDAPARRVMSGIERGCFLIADIRLDRLANLVLSRLPEI